MNKNIVYQHFAPMRKDFVRCHSDLMHVISIQAPMNEWQKEAEIVQKLKIHFTKISFIFFHLQFNRLNATTMNE